jgi:hypothetical protein
MRALDNYSLPSFSLRSGRAAIAAGGETNFNKKLKIFMTIINIPLRVRIYFLRAGRGDFLFAGDGRGAALSPAAARSRLRCALAVLAKLFN